MDICVDYPHTQGVSITIKTQCSLLYLCDPNNGGSMGIQFGGHSRRNQARSFRRRISRKFRRRPRVEVFDLHSNESRISAANGTCSSAALAVVGEVFQPQFGSRNPGFVFSPISFPVYSHAICTWELKFLTLFLWQRGCTSHTTLRVTFPGLSIRHQNSAAKTECEACGCV
jgi:hypothetical protein